MEYSNGVFQPTVEAPLGANQGRSASAQAAYDVYDVSDEGRLPFEPPVSSSFSCYV